MVSHTKIRADRSSVSDEYIEVDHLRNYDRCRIHYYRQAVDEFQMPVYSRDSMNEYRSNRLFHMKNKQHIRYIPDE
jgi:hypothetical protein